MSPPPLPHPTVRAERTFTLLAKKSVGIGVVTLGVGGMAAGVYAAWEPIEGRQVDSPNTLVPSNPQCLHWGCLHLWWKCNWRFIRRRAIQLGYTKRPRSLDRSWKS